MDQASRYYSRSHRRIFNEETTRIQEVQTQHLATKSRRSSHPTLVFQTYARSQACTKVKGSYTICTEKAKNWISWKCCGSDARLKEDNRLEKTLNERPRSSQYRGKLLKYFNGSEIWENKSSIIPNQKKEQINSLRESSAAEANCRETSFLCENCSLYFSKSFSNKWRQIAWTFYETCRERTVLKPRKTRQVSNYEVLSQTTLWPVTYDQRLGKEEFQEYFKTSNQNLQQ